MWLCAYSQVCQFLKRGANQQALDNKGRVSGSMLKKKFILQIDVNGQEDVRRYWKRTREITLFDWPLDLYTIWYLLESIQEQNWFKELVYFIIYRQIYLMNAYFVQKKGFLLFFSLIRNAFISVWFVSTYVKGHANVCWFPLGSL